VPHDVYGSSQGEDLQEGVGGGRELIFLDEVAPEIVAQALYLSGECSRVRLGTGVGSLEWVNVGGYAQVAEVGQQLGDGRRSRLLVAQDEH